jgi:hypothetical protein
MCTVLLPLGIHPIAVNKYNIFIKQWPVSAPSLDHHQAIIAQESGYTDRSYKSLSSRSPLLHKSALKTYAKNAGQKRV